MTKQETNGTRALSMGRGLSLQSPHGLVVETSLQHPGPVNSLSNGPAFRFHDQMISTLHTLSINVNLWVLSLQRLGLWGVWAQPAVLCVLCGGTCVPLTI